MNGKNEYLDMVLKESTTRSMLGFKALLQIVALLLISSSSSSFAPLRPQTRSSRSYSTVSVGLRQKADKNNDSDVVNQDLNPFARASWYAVETFGKVFGGGRSNTEENVTLTKDTVDYTKPSKSVAETLKRIELDNDRSYFLSGEVDKLIYDDQCIFADPFVSFSGRDRFVDNLSNLGAFITEYDARLLEYQTLESSLSVQTKVMVKLQLGLPWKPILAWPWGVKYDIDPESYLITSHVESWDIDPIQGIKQIFRKPTTKINKSVQ